MGRCIRNSTRSCPDCICTSAPSLAGNCGLARYSIVTLIPVCSVKRCASSCSFWSEAGTKWVEVRSATSRGWAWTAGGVLRQSRAASPGVAPREVFKKRLRVVGRALCIASSVPRSTCIRYLRACHRPTSLTGLRAVPSNYEARCLEYFYRSQVSGDDPPCSSLSSRVFLVYVHVRSTIGYLAMYVKELAVSTCITRSDFDLTGSTVLLFLQRRRIRSAATLEQMMSVSQQARPRVSDAFSASM